MTNIITTKGLCHRYGAQEAVAGLDLDVPQGSIFALLGANGAGKTTTIKTLMNILEPSAGSASVLGVSSTQLGPAEFRRIGYVSENQEMPEWMTLDQFLAYCRPFYPAWDTEFCERLIAQFKLPRDRKLKSFSRGMKMKAALLSSLAYRPELLVLDEPFSGLDPLARDEFVSGMLSLVDEAQWTILISSHDIEEVERLVDWVGFLENGRMRLCEPVSSLQERFRFFDVALDGAGQPPGPPPVPRSEWLDLKGTAHSVSFVDSRFHPSESEVRLREAYPHVRDFQSSAMSLREIFVALARTSSQPATQS